MNVWDLIQVVTARLPGYTPAEYLRELNAIYIDELWAAAKNLESSYFENIVTVTVAAQQDTFDFRFNQDGGLSAAVDPRLEEITLIQCQGPQSNALVEAVPRPVQSDDWLRFQVAVPPQVNQAGPYFYRMFNRETIGFPSPLAVGTKIKITYVMSLLPLQFLTDGTVSSSGVTVTGTGTFFTQLLPPDFALNLPGQLDYEAATGAELQITNGQGRAINYKVATITDDTHLVLQTAPNPALVGASYTLASTPEFPDGVHYVLSTIATRNLMTTPADDDRFQVWAALASDAKERFENTIMLRQRQRGPQKRRFPHGVKPSVGSYTIR